MIEFKHDYCRCKPILVTGFGEFLISAETVQNDVQNRRTTRFSIQWDTHYTLIF